MTSDGKKSKHPGRDGKVKSVKVVEIGKDPIIKSRYGSIIPCEHRE
jgi:hypothetical protein